MSSGPATAVLIVLLLAGCPRSKVDYWGQPAGPDEKLSPGFSDQAAKLYSAARQAREKLMNSDAEFDEFQPTLSQLREETRKAVHTRVDRGLDWLVNGYSGKVLMLRYYRNLRNGAEYLPALREQLDRCQVELDGMFAEHPFPRPSWGKPLGPCLAAVPQTK
jgi:hypothetical protein